MTVGAPPLVCSEPDMLGTGSEPRPNGTPTRVDWPSLACSERYVLGGGSDSAAVGAPMTVGASASARVSSVRYSGSPRSVPTSGRSSTDWLSSTEVGGRLVCSCTAGTQVPPKTDVLLSMSSTGGRTSSTAESSPRLDMPRVDGAVATTVGAECEGPDVPVPPVPCEGWRTGCTLGTCVGTSRDVEGDCWDLRAQSAADHPGRTCEPRSVPTCDPRRGVSGPAGGRS